MKKKKWILRLLLLVVVAPAAIGAFTPYPSYFCMGSAVLALGWDLLCNKVWRCPLCGGRLEKRTKSSVCPNCHEDLGIDMMIIL
jgi:hypothetical protein